MFEDKDDEQHDSDQEGDDISLDETADSNDCFERLPMEMLELILIKTFMMSFVRDCDLLEDYHSAYVFVASVSYIWQTTLQGWPQSNSRLWLKNVLKRAIPNLHRAKLNRRLLNGSFTRLFNVERLLGAGARGHVFKAQCSTDNKAYAIKAIRVRPRIGKTLPDIFRQPMKEVGRHTTLERNHAHPNIVRYYGSWIEEADGCQRTIDRYRDLYLTQQQQQRPPAARNLLLNHSPDAGLPASCGSPAFGPAALPRKKRARPSSSERDMQSAAEVRASDGANNKNQRGQLMMKTYYLFIRLELCTTTIKDWLTHRDTLILQNPQHRPDDGDFGGVCAATLGGLASQLKSWVCDLQDEPPTKEFFRYVSPTPTNKCLRDILRGLNFMHSKRLAHSDLHAANVLVVDDGHDRIVTKISDFGCVKTLEKMLGTTAQCGWDSVAASRSGDLSPEASIIGHPFSEHERCKNDMKLLIDIICALYYPGMRLECPAEGSRSIPRGHPFSEHFPQQSGWISQLMNEDASGRPGAASMLLEGKQLGMFQSDRIDLDICLVTQQEEIRRHREQLSAQREEIEGLKEANARLLAQSRN